MLPAVLSLLLFAQVDASDAALRPEERTVLFVEAAAGSYAKDRSVRLLPMRVFKTHTQGVTGDAITARDLSSSDPLARRVIMANDLTGEDRKWFEREALKLWQRYPTMEFLLGEKVRALIIEGER